MNKRVFLLLYLPLYNSLSTLPKESKAIVNNNNPPMVFSSLPAYLDPSNWHHHQQQQQQQQHQHRGLQADGRIGQNPHPQQLQHPPLPQPTPPLPPPPQLQQKAPHGPVGGGAMIRPGSMAERARLANIPMPEAALKCPRCESTNTKFCYFNNYNLSQPRHFCKACRRYWTSGGALRSVPVGGGCRRNKRTKSSGSNKSNQQSTMSPSGGSMSNNSGSSHMLASSAGSETSTTAELLGLMTQIPPLGLISPLHHHHNHHLNDFSSSKIDLSYSGISMQPLEGIGGSLNFQFDSSGDGSGRNSLLSAASTGGIEQWRVQQFPYIGNQDLQAGLYPNYESVGEPSILVTKPLTSGLTSQPTSAKMENSHNNNNQAELNNLSRQMTRIQGNEQFWSTRGSVWTDHSGFGSSSTGNNNAM